MKTKLTFPLFLTIFSLLLSFQLLSQISENIKDPAKNGDPCPGIPTVTYEGQVYNTVQIGNQCWLKENLNVGTMINGSSNQTNNGTIEKYCYEDNPDNCDIYGGLYQWDEMMQYTTQEGVQGICPEGWHLPTDAEYCTVTKFLDPSVNCGAVGYSGTHAGGKMKATGTIQGGDGLWNEPNAGATNESGFSGLPAGYRDTGGTFSSLGYSGWFWSSSVHGSYRWYWKLSGNEARVYRYSYYGLPENGFSVRCLKD